MYKIYVIINTINNKLYIGQTKHSLNKRFSGHKTKSNNGSKSALHCAMRLHGIENFSIELIYECSTLEEVNIKEIEYIKRFNSIAPYGYNILEGGDCAPKIISGPFTEEHKNKIKDAHKKGSKPIVQFDIKTGELIKEWSSGKDLLRGGFNRANIISLCKSTKAFGYIYDYGWCYKTTYESVTDKTTFATAFYSAHGRTIKCLDMNDNLVKIYYKIVDAARELNCNPSSISDCVNGRAKTCKGYKWAYL
jgi:group I intron endonuclease